MQRFFVEPCQIDEKEKRIRITGEDVNHIRNVLRMRIGEEIYVSTGEDLEFYTRISELDADEVSLEILEVRKTAYELPCAITLYQGLPKGDKMELIIQKAVELGASRIVPVSMHRCVMKLDPKKAPKKIARWQQISESAAKQSKRMIIPQVGEVLSYKEALKEAAGLTHVLVPYELAGGMKETRSLIREVKPGDSVGIFIGPEGGFEEKEIQEAIEAGAKPITLGHRILRTETAGMTILSVLMFELEQE